MPDPKIFAAVLVETDIQLSAVINALTKVGEKFCSKNFW